MKSRVSTPVAVALVVVAVVIVAFVGWKLFAGPSVPRDAQGNPTVAGPPEAQSGAKALQGLFQQGVQPKQNARDTAPAGR